NKQFIAPLPIPDATIAERNAVATAAEALQILHTTRRDLLARLATRLNAAPRITRPETWLFPSLKHGNTTISTQFGLINDRLHPVARLTAELQTGELKFLIDGVPVITNVFVDITEAEFLLAQWRYTSATFNPSSSGGAKSLCKALRDLAIIGNLPLVQQVIATIRELSECETSIATQETVIETQISALYRLTDAERRLIGKA
ncbi:hypothetical protein, partial [Acidiphilium sp.]|uniref:hypothetical protein n=1 Tax=Acidiphilium sp. TaxID=527 RepID=UPI003D05B82E